MPVNLGRFISTTGTHQGLAAIGFARTDCFPPDGADTLDRVRSPRVVPPALPGEGKRSQVACPVFCSMLGTWVGLDGPN